TSRRGIIDSLGIMKLVNKSVRNSATITTSLSRNIGKLSCFFAFFSFGSTACAASVDAVSFIAWVILACGGRVKAPDRTRGVDTVDRVLGESAPDARGRVGTRRNPPKFRVCNHRPAA